jgi:hypothetical protein
MVGPTSNSIFIYRSEFVKTGSASHICFAIVATDAYRRLILTLSIHIITGLYQKGMQK